VAIKRPMNGAPPANMQNCRARCTRADLVCGSRTWPECTNGFMTGCGLYGQKETVRQTGLNCDTVPTDSREVMENGTRVYHPLSSMMCFCEVRVSSAP
jgi:hypothetical protein